MNEGQRKQLEAKLRQMIALQDQAQSENQESRKPPRGTKVIRRRKGAPDKHIL